MAMKIITASNGYTYKLEDNTMTRLTPECSSKNVKTVTINLDVPRFKVNNSINAQQLIDDINNLKILYLKELNIHDIFDVYKDNIANTIQYCVSLEFNCETRQLTKEDANLGISTITKGLNYLL